MRVRVRVSRGDLALESSAHVLAVAEHRLVPARARTVTTQLRQARRSSVLSGCYSWWPCGSWRHQSSWCHPFSSYPFRSLLQGVLSHWSCYEGYPSL